MNIIDSNERDFKRHLNIRNVLFIIINLSNTLIVVCKSDIMSSRYNQVGYNELSGYNEVFFGPYVALFRPGLYSVNRLTG